MKLTPELISYLPYLPEKDSIGLLDGHPVKITTNPKYISSTRQFGSYESPYCIEAENFYLNNLGDLQTNHDSYIKSNHKISLPFVYEDSIVFDSRNGKIWNSEVLCKQDIIPSTIIQDINGLELFIGSPRIIGRTGLTEDIPVFLKAVNDREIESNDLSKNLINFNEIPFVKPVVCLIRNVEEQNNNRIRSLLKLLGNVLESDENIRLKKSWGDFHLDV